jgi:hypothetical protein
MKNTVFTRSLPIIRLIFTAFVVINLNGCANLYQLYSVKPLSEGGSTLTKIKDMLKKELQGEDVFDKNCFDANTTAYECQGQRNAAVAGLMATSDELCLEHARGIYGNEAAYNLGFGTLTNVFAGAATFTGGAAAKEILSSFALISNAERSLINETVYKTMLVTSVSKKIREGRLEQRNAMIKRMRSDNITDYTMNEALLNVLEYHNTCSFMYGLEKALEDGNQNGTELKKLALERQLQKLNLEKKLRENELEVLKKTDSSLIKADDADLKGLNLRVKALHDALQALETPALPKASE